MVSRPHKRMKLVPNLLSTWVNFGIGSGIVDGSNYLAKLRNEDMNLVSKTKQAQTQSQTGVHIFPYIWMFIKWMHHWKITSCTFIPNLM